jgi:acetoin utilization protein AcuB
MNIGQIMRQELATVEPDDSLHRVKELFDLHGFHHLLVVEQGRLVGIISDRDLLRNVSPFIGRLSERTQDASTLDRRVHQIMTRKPVTVQPAMALPDAVQLMLANPISCLPVVTETGQLIGVVTWRDLLRNLYAVQAIPAA